MFPFVTICSSQSCPVSPMQKTHHDYSQGKQKALFRCKCMLIKTSDSQGLLFGFILIKKTGGGGEVLQCKHAQILKTCRVTLKCTQGYEQSLLEPPSTAYFSTKSEAKKRLLYLSKSLHSTSDASGQWWKLFLWPQRDRK